MVLMISACWTRHQVVWVQVLTEAGHCFVFLGKTIYSHNAFLRVTFHSYLPSGQWFECNFLIQSQLPNKILIISKKTFREAQIGGHSIYKIEDTKLIPIANELVRQKFQHPDESK